MLAVVSVMVLSGCYKEEERAKAKEILVTKTWVIEKHFYGVVDSIFDCNIAKQVVFNMDSTGYYYYPTKCAASDNDTLKFKWWVLKDNKSLFLSKIDGVSFAESTMNIVYYDSKTLTIEGPDYKSRYLSGHFRAE